MILAQEGASLVVVRALGSKAKVVAVAPAQAMVEVCLDVEEGLMAAAARMVAALVVLMVVAMVVERA